MTQDVTLDALVRKELQQLIFAVHKAEVEGSPIYEGGHRERQLLDTYGSRIVASLAAELTRLRDYRYVTRIIRDIAATDTDDIEGMRVAIELARITRDTHPDRRAALTEQEGPR